MQRELRRAYGAAPQDARVTIDAVFESLNVYLGNYIGRNVTTAVRPIAEVNNYILPLWLIAMGLILVRWKPIAT